MKKINFIASVITGAILVISCSSQPPAPAQTPVQESSPVPEAQTYEEAAYNIYSKYRDSLIMEDASTHRVVWRDTLSRLARQRYNNGFYFPLIMLASIDVVVDPDKIIPGMVLTIPDLGKNLENAEARASIKLFLLEIAKLEDERRRPRDAEGLRNLSNRL